MGGGTKLKDQDDALGHGENFLKDSYTATVKSKEGIDLRSAGLNGYGDFVVIGNDGQVVRVHNTERFRLAAYLLSPLLETTPVYMPAAVKMMEDQQQQNKIDPQFRTYTRSNDSKPARKGIIARK